MMVELHEGDVRNEPRPPMFVLPLEAVAVEELRVQLDVAADTLTVDFAADDPAA